MRAVPFWFCLKNSLNFPQSIIFFPYPVAEYQGNIERLIISFSKKRKWNVDLLKYTDLAFVIDYWLKCIYQTLKTSFNPIPTFIKYLLVSNRSNSMGLTDFAETAPFSQWRNAIISLKPKSLCSLSNSRTYTI